nr:MAG TPA: hypothetical protein [Caudoviricetes sp.]
MSNPAILQPYSLLPCQYDMMQNNTVTIHIGTMFNSFISSPFF